MDFPLPCEPERAVLCSENAAKSSTLEPGAAATSPGPAHSHPWMFVPLCGAFLLWGMALPSWESTRGNRARLELLPCVCLRLCCCCVGARQAGQARGQGSQGWLVPWCRLRKALASCCAEGGHSGRTPPPPHRRPLDFRGSPREGRCALAAFGPSHAEGQVAGAASRRRPGCGHRLA